MKQVQPLLVRIAVVLTIAFGLFYLVWRWTSSVNWSAWWIAVPLVLAETYAFTDACLFGLTMWRQKRRGEPPAAPEAPEQASVDVFVTTYNEPVELVTETLRAALRIEYPHRTWVLDDGARPEMRAEAERLGVGYIERGPEWSDRPRHAKAGNLNNALTTTTGEFILVLDADQVPDPRILHRTLGYFDDPKVALVQTPQWFGNVTESDPLGSQAPLFYGPIQQGKDGWNAAFFCGSNAVLRREALMDLGVSGYVRSVETKVRQALRTAHVLTARAARTAAAHGPAAVAAVRKVRLATMTAERRLAGGDHLATVTYEFQREVDAAARELVSSDLAEMAGDLAELELADGSLTDDIDTTAGMVARREWSPLNAIESIRTLATAIDVDRAEEAQPLLPLATISVTEDMATCMRLHARGWSSVYHHEVLARGLAPEDLKSMLQQKLRWSQGAMQVMLKENPLFQKGLSIGQRLMYFATMWSYLSGFAAIPFLAAPLVYVFFGVLPVRAYGLDFLVHFAPYLLLSQSLFAIVGKGVKTWRGHQYGLALFPVWIRAFRTAAANVFAGSRLDFVVTPKVRQRTGRFPWGLVVPQQIATAGLLLAAGIGSWRLWTGTAPSALGTLVNVVWAVYNVVLLSVIYQAALARAPRPTTSPAVEPLTAKEALS